MDINKINAMEKKLLEEIGSEELLNAITQWLSSWQLEEIYNDIATDYEIDFE